MSNDTLNRREFFKRAAILGAAVTGAGSFLAACERGGGGQSESGGQAQKEGGGAGEELDCTDTSGLEPAQVKVRESLQYTDDSPEAGKTCDNCQLYKPASTGSCGGCQTVPGPIHPKGWCSAWVAKA